MKSKKETKFTLEKFEEAKLKNLKVIVGGSGGSGLSGNDPTGGGGRNTNGTQQGGNI